jgi:hypothetical protein
MNICFKSFFLWMIIVSIGGCASILNDAQQTIAIRTDCQTVVLNRSCTASIGSQTLTFETPARLKVPRSTESITVHCEGGLLHGASTDVFSGISTGVMGNFVSGGAVGVVIDLKTRKGFSYPSVTNIVMPICQFL